MTQMQPGTESAMKRTFHKCKLPIFPVTSAVALVFALMPHKASAAVDFETVPGIDPPSEGMGISNQYAPGYGITFTLSSGQQPILAQVGSPAVGYNSYAGDDTPAPGQNVGNFFLVDPNTQFLGSPPPPDLLVSYSSPMITANGVILDIDQSEAWLIQALNSSHLVIDSMTLDPGSINAGDGLATAWSFTHETADIAAVQISYTGATAFNIGYGWDNFSSEVPEPSAGIILALGSLLFLGCFVVRKRTRV